LIALLALVRDEYVTKAQPFGEREKIVRERKANLIFLATK
jgi:hypothetical protein